MVNWMLYNIKIACANGAPKRETAIEEINLVMKTLMKLKKLIPDFIELSTKN